MSKHTPGPWSLKTEVSKWNIDAGKSYPVAVVDAKGERVRFACVTISSGPECEANARLIAEAPAMLACLQMLHTDDLDAVLKEFEAILARLEAA